MRGGPVTGLDATIGSLPLGASAALPGRRSVTRVSLDGYQLDGAILSLAEALEVAAAWSQPASLEDLLRRSLELCARRR